MKQRQGNVIKKLILACLLGIISSAALFIFLNVDQQLDRAIIVKEINSSERLVEETSSTSQATSTISPTDSRQDIERKSVSELILDSEYPRKVTISLTDSINIEKTFKIDDFSTLNQFLSNNLTGRGQLYDLLIDATDQGITAAPLELFRLLESCFQLSEGGITDHYEINLVTESCQGISDAQIKDRAQWVDRGVTMNAFGALTYKAHQIEGSDKAAAFELYELAWKSGHTGTLLTLATFFRDGIPNLNRGEPDLVTAYAYTLLDAAVTRAALQLNGKIPNPNTTSQIEQYVAVQQATLTAGEIEKAEELAQQLLEDNENCCVNLWRHY